MTKLQKTFGKFVFLLCCAALFWAPIPLASNRPWAWTLLEFLIGITFSLHLLNVLFGGETLLRKNWQWWVIAPLLAVTGFLGLQILGFVPGISTVDPTQTEIMLLKTLYYALFAWLITQYVYSDKRLRLLCYVIVAAGVFQASYGSILNLLGSEYSPVFAVPEGNRARGSFVYQNHFANFLAMAISLGLGVLMSELSSRKISFSLRTFSRTVLDALLSEKLLLRLSLVIMVIGLVLSRSRMGNAAFFTALAVVALYALIFYRNKPALLKPLVISIFVLDLIVIGSMFGIEKLQQRFEDTSFASETRDEVVRDSLPMIADAPWFGHGGGTFYTVFPGYQPGHYSAFYDHAHNEYVQFAAEIGVPLTLMLGFWLVALLVLNLLTMKQRENKLSRGIAFGCSMAIVHMLIHNLVDFNLQAPANALLFITVLCLSLVVYFRQDVKTASRQNENVSQNLYKQGGAF